MRLEPGKIKWGLIFIVAGTLLLANNYELFSVSFKFSRDWPAIIIALGLLSAWDGIFARRKDKKTMEGGESRKQKLMETLEEIEKGRISAEEGARRIKD